MQPRQWPCSVVLILIFNYLTLFYEVQCQFGSPISSTFGIKFGGKTDSTVSNPPNPITMTLFWEQLKFQCTIDPQITADPEGFFSCSTIGNTNTMECDGTNNPTSYGVQIDTDTSPDYMGIDIVKIVSVYSSSTITFESDWFHFPPYGDDNYQTYFYLHEDEAEHTKGNIGNKFLVIFNDGSNFKPSGDKLLGEMGNDPSISRLESMSTFAVCSTPTTTKEPSVSPSNNPSMFPSKFPTLNPTIFPTLSPTNIPSTSPTNIPSTSPTNMPTRSPTKVPSTSPTNIPSKSPANIPSTSPTNIPSKSPTNIPTMSPTNIPTISPTNIPSTSPTNIPSSSPTGIPSTSPTVGWPTESPLILASTSSNPTISTNNPTSSQLYPTPTSSPTNIATNIVTIDANAITTVLNDNSWIIWASIGLGSIACCLVSIIIGYHVQKQKKKSKKKTEETQTQIGFARVVSASKQEKKPEEPGAINLRSWLSNIGLMQYCNIFEENGFDTHNISKLWDHLNEQDLEEMGIANKEHRKLILVKQANILNKGGEPQINDNPQLDNFDDSSSEQLYGGTGDQVVISISNKKHLNAEQIEELYSNENNEQATTIDSKYSAYMPYSNDTGSV